MNKSQIGQNHITHEGINHVLKSDICVHTIFKIIPNNNLIILHLSEPNPHTIVRESQKMELAWINDVQLEILVKKMGIDFEINIVLFLFLSMLLVYPKSWLATACI